MKYALDLERLPLAAYKALLKNQNLLPGRKGLLEEVDARFSALERLGVTTVAQLLKRLSTPAKVATAAAESGVPADYLTVLRRQAGGLEQKPVALMSFPGLDPERVAKLGAAGIGTSKDYFENARDPSDDLYALCDLVRINGVGPAAARAFYAAGYRRAADVAAADAADMLARVGAANAAGGYYRAKLGLGDMRFCIDCAALLMKLGG